VLKENGDKHLSSTRRRNAQKRRAAGAYHHLSFGWGVRMAEESWYVDIAFQGLVSTRSFRRLLRALKVPMLVMGETRWVDMHRFELAMTAVLRIGEPDFVPQAPQGSLNYTWQRGHSTDTLDEERFRKNWELVIRDLIAAKQCNGTKVQRKVKRAATLAAERMLMSGLQFLPSRLQEERDEKLAENIKLDEPDASLIP
jgi:hypothetical protein